MGYIKEPEGVDFIICGNPLTAEEKKAISEFIKLDKAKHKMQFFQKTKNRQKEKVFQD